MTKRQVYWLVSGFIFAPVVNALAWLVLNLIYGSHSSSLDDILSVTYMVTFFTAPFIIMVGVPSLALAHHFKLVRWWVAAIVGLSSGAWLAYSMFNLHGIVLVQYAINGAAPALFVWWCWHSAYNRKPIHSGT